MRGLGRTMKNFRFSVDDCIEFLRDLSMNDYRSVFDNDFLGFLQSVHLKYDAVFCLNLFYENTTSAGFAHKKPPFCLSDMTGRYKREFEENSDWLKFSFHAKAEHPATPYRTSGYREVFRDAQAVNAEIARFAGRSSLSEEMTLHCGLCTCEGFKGLTDSGYRIFYGYLCLNHNGDPSGSYYFDRAFLEQNTLRRFDDNGYTFRKTDLLLNAYKHEDDMARDLQPLIEENLDFCELMFHEQYFYPDYVRYIERYRRIIERAAQMMTSAGYNGGFLS